MRNDLNPPEILFDILSTLRFYMFKGSYGGYYIYESLLEEGYSVKKKIRKFIVEREAAEFLHKKRTEYAAFLRNHYHITKRKKPKNVKSPAFLLPTVLDELGIANIQSESKSEIPF